ncbi:glycosyltransferase [Thermoproteota archaeon]
MTKSKKLSDFNYFSSIQLVITAALDKELPIPWIRSKGFPVFHITALDSGILKTLTPETPGVLFVITGTGLSASKKAAIWIKNNLNPLFVVNLGTCGLLEGDFQQGDWVIPRFSIDDTNNPVKLDTRIPFSLPKELTIFQAGALLSVDQPVFDPEKYTFSKHFENKLDPSDELELLKKPGFYVDMESYAQAEIFDKHAISFHSIKMITDYANHSTRTDYFAAVNRCRTGIQVILEWLEPKPMVDISVIIPVFNRQDHIKECVDSVLNQTLSPKEVIVVNDASQDKTSKILNAYGNKIKVIDLDKNKGVSFARNIGVKESQGNWICFLDSDDKWTPDKLENQAEFFKKYPFYEVLQSQEVWIRNGKRVNSCQHHDKPQGWVFEQCLDLCLISPSSVMIKKDLFWDFGGFDESFPACEDYDLWIRLSRQKPVGLDPSLSTIKYGGHADQLSKQFPAMDRFRVQSLLKALSQEENLNYKQKINDLLNEKLHILIQGAKKRNLVTDVNSYQDILSRLGTE